MKTIWQYSFLIMMLAGCSFEKNDHDDLSTKNDNSSEVEPPKLQDSSLQLAIIHNLLINLPNLRAKKVVDEKATGVFSGSLSFCTNFNTYKPYIIEDNSWLIYEGDEFIALAREFKFMDKYQAERFAVEMNKWAKMFYTLPRNTWNSTNIGCWPNHTDKFYEAVHEGNKVMLIGDGDQYNYYFYPGDSIKDFHAKNNTDFYRFLIALKSKN